MLFHRILSIAVMLCLCGPALGEEQEVDPLEGFNRKIFAFNAFADKYALKPVAKGYDTITPDFVQRRVGNFFANLNDLNNGVNNLLQGKPKAGVGDFGRLLINTTVGLGGLFDPATRLGLDKHEEDWGQTFGVWGIGEGPYVVLPFLGPSTLRHAFGRPVNSVLDPVAYLHPERDRYLVYLLRIIDDRAALLEAEKAIFGDRYIFMRGAYLQRREYLVKDGEVSDPFAEDF